MKLPCIAPLHSYHTGQLRGNRAVYVVAKPQLTMGIPTKRPHATIHCPAKAVRKRGH
jgi:hypothetical protein